MSEKKSFLLYFDMYPYLAGLPLEQCGALFLALFQYAIREAQQEGMGSSILEEERALSAEARMALKFLSGVVYRDTVKWRQKHLRYQQAARERSSRQREGELRQYIKDSQCQKTKKAQDDAWDYV